MNWILQHKDFGLGNFINLTPTLQAIHKLTGEKVKVHFESDYVKEAFLGCPFIDEIEKPNYPPLFTSAMINKVIPDWQYVYHQVRGMFYPNLPEEIEFHTWVRQPKTIVLLNGCASPSKSETKRYSIDIYWKLHSIITDTGKYSIIFKAGLNEDFWSMGSDNEDMDDALYWIKNADLVIGNDTGLMHAAGAMKKKCFIMWKDTLLEKNKSPNPNAFYSMKGNWINDFKEWIGTV